MRGVAGGILKVMGPLFFETGGMRMSWEVNAKG